MLKFISLLKAMMSQDMNLFRYKSKSNSSTVSKIMLPIVLSLIVMYAIGIYYYSFAAELSKINLTYIVLSIAIAASTVITFIEGLYKVPTILFEPKDNNLVFSLPIDKKEILFARLVKLYIFQLLYSVLFVTSGIVIYAYFEHPAISFYFISLLMVLLLPIIPTIIACIIGYIIKRISLRFKFKKVVQTILTFAALLVVFFLSFKSQEMINSVTQNAIEINNFITSTYYPIEIYLSLINKFDLLILAKLLLIVLVPLVLFVWIGGINYFKTISKSNEKSASSNKNKKILYKQDSQIGALVIKELKRYFSSSIYVFNTMFGLILMLIATISLCVNMSGFFTVLTSEEIPAEVSDITSFIPKILYMLIIGMSFMTSITSSSISIEGKTFNISKSIPVKPEKILLAKVLMSNLICIPFFLLCDIIFISVFSVGMIDLISIILITFIAPTISSMIGLIVNLKNPKMNASSDAEVIKQSMSAMVSVFIGIAISMLLVGFVFIGFVINVKIEIMMIIELILLIIAVAVLWNKLKTSGTKYFRQIEI